MSLQKWKELAEKRRLAEQYYKEKYKAIKDYKFRGLLVLNFMRGWQNQSQKR